MLPIKWAIWKHDVCPMRTIWISPYTGYMLPTMQAAVLGGGRRVPIGARCTRASSAGRARQLGAGSRVWARGTAIGAHSLVSPRRPALGGLVREAGLRRGATGGLRHGAAGACWRPHAWMGWWC